LTEAGFAVLQISTRFYRFAFYGYVAALGYESAVVEGIVDFCHPSVQTTLTPTPDKGKG